jgi:hypothetical protein
MMATRSGTLGSIASKTMAAGRVHMAKALLGQETLPEAAGGVVDDLLSGSKAKPVSHTAAKKFSVKTKAARRKTGAKNISTRESLKQSNQLDRTCSSPRYSI